MWMNDVQKAFQLGQLILAHSLIVGILTELLRAMVVPDGQKPGRRFRLYSVIIGMVWGMVILGVVSRDYFPPYVPGLAGGAILGVIIGAAASGGKDYVLNLIWKNAEATAQKRAEYGVGTDSSTAAAAASAAAQAAITNAAQTAPSSQGSLAPSPAPLPASAPYDDADDFIPGRGHPRGFLGAYSAPPETEGLPPETFNRTGVPFDP